MYYYEKYNIYVMMISFVVLSISFFFILKEKTYAIIDPLVANIIWCASNLALLLGYFYSREVSLDGIVFVLVLLIYVAGLYIFLDSTPRSMESLQKGLNDKKNELIFVICFLLNIASRFEFFTYAIDNPSIASWFLYKFTQWQGRSFWQYILQIGARPFFTYYLFVLLKTKEKLRPVLILILVLNSLLDIVAGGRSSLLGLLNAYGYFIYYFSSYYSRKSIGKMNFYGVTFIFLSLLNSIVVTSFYSSEGTIEEGATHMANRILSAGDGLEMYLVNNASRSIDSGFIEYTKAVFGIFIKQVIPIETQSIGWKLYEMNSGIPSPISVGPNFILPLQAIILGKLFFVPYTLFICFVISFLRGNKLSKKYVKSQPLSFVLGLLTFQLVIDAEFFVLQLCACLFIYFLFLYPFKKFTLVLDWSTVFFKYKSSLKAKNSKLIT